jgi:hypothetical protein
VDSKAYGIPAYLREGADIYEMARNHRTGLEIHREVLHVMHQDLASCRCNQWHENRIEEEEEKPTKRRSVKDSRSNGSDWQGNGCVKSSNGAYYE